MRLNLQLFLYFLKKKNSSILYSVFLFLVLTNVAYSFSEFCTTPYQENNETYYRFDASSLKCIKASDCWISFRPPEDALVLKLDELEIYRFDKYISNEILLLHLMTLPTSSSVTIRTKDLNQSKKNQGELCVVLGGYFELKLASAYRWFYETGVTLYSAFFLFIVFLILLFSLWFVRSPIGNSLLFYCFVSILYLISFSEYPRMILDPILFSGGIHFPLRLLQDLALVYVFYNLYQSYDSKNIIRLLTYLYLAVLGAYVFMLIIGIRDYVFFHRVILIMAPLVAAPMAIGAYFSFKLTDKTERIILIPMSVLLLSFQINDLLVFWGVFDGYFTVRIYIPFIVIITLFLYFRRIYSMAILYRANLERQNILKEFVHDVRSPLAVLRTFLHSSEFNERSLVQSAALNRIEAMVNDIDNPKQEPSTTKIPVTLLLRSIILQKKAEYKDVQIEHEIPTGGEVFFLGDAEKLQRVFSNFINNSIESYSAGVYPKVKISVDIGEDKLILRISDYGNGIPPEILESLLSNISISSKGLERGKGVVPSVDYLKSIGARCDLISKPNVGTTLFITFPASQQPEWYKDTCPIFDKPVIEINSLEDFKNETMIDRDCIMEINANLDFSHIRGIRMERSTKFMLLSPKSFNSSVLGFLCSCEGFTLIGSTTNITPDEVRKDARIVLIDDDKYIRLSWEYFGATSKINVLTYSSVDQFLEDAVFIPTDCAIYLDLNLKDGNSMRYLPKINKLGFNNVFIATGESISLNEFPEYVKGIVGKLPPNYLN